MEAPRSNSVEAKLLQAKWLRNVLGLHAAECPPAQAGLYRPTLAARGLYDSVGDKELWRLADESSLDLMRGHKMVQVKHLALYLVFAGPLF